MADGPRCKRRKQANPRRNNVFSLNSQLAIGQNSHLKP
uniref:Zinc finger E-box binding homeobox 1 n=1 Tax=Mus musculus TaxID=10090 RepID=A0A3Q4EHM2_MOUSE